MPDTFQLGLQWLVRRMPIGKKIVLCSCGLADRILMGTFNCSSQYAVRAKISRKSRLSRQERLSSSYHTSFASCASRWLNVKTPMYLRSESSAGTDSPGRRSGARATDIRGGNSASKWKRLRKRATMSRKRNAAGPASGQVSGQRRRSPSLDYYRAPAAIAAVLIARHSSLSFDKTWLLLSGRIYNGSGARSLFFFNVLCAIPVSTRPLLDRCTALHDPIAVCMASRVSSSKEENLDSYAIKSIIHIESSSPRFSGLIA